MTPETPDLMTLAHRVERLAERLDALELQVRGLVTTPTVEAQEFLVRDARSEIRARLEMAAHAPHFTFFDPTGKERLQIGLRTDGSPLLRVEQREVPLERVAAASGEVDLA